jgi:hypothetical protein
MEHRKMAPQPSAQRPARKRTGRTLSARFYRVSLFVLLALVVALVAILLLRP